MFSSKIDDYFGKTLNYLPYKYSIFFQKPLLYSKKDIQANNSNSKKLYYFVSSTEKKSALDYLYWEFKMLHQISNQSTKKEFEKNFINLAILILLRLIRVLLIQKVLLVRGKIPGKNIFLVLD